MISKMYLQHWRNDAKNRLGDNKISLSYFPKLAFQTRTNHNTQNNCNICLNILVIESIIKEFDIRQTTKWMKTKNQPYHI